MAYQKGQSGNPGGRPKAVAEIRDLAQKMCPEVLEILFSIARKGESEQAQVAAGREIMDRGLGRAAQAMTGEGGIGPIVVTWKKPQS